MYSNTETLYQLSLFAEILLRKLGETNFCDHIPIDKVFCRPYNHYVATEVKSVVTYTALILQVDACDYETVTKMFPA